MNKQDFELTEDEKRRMVRKYYRNSYTYIDNTEKAVLAKVMPVLEGQEAAIFVLETDLKSVIEQNWDKCLLLEARDREIAELKETIKKFELALEIFPLDESAKQDRGSNG